MTKLTKEEREKRYALAWRWRRLSLKEKEKRHEAQLKKEEAGVKKIVKNLDLAKLEKRIILVFVIGLIFYISLVLFADYNKVIKISFNFNWQIVLLLLLLSFLNYILRFIRWHYFLYVACIYRQFYF